MIYRLLSPVMREKARTILFSALFGGVVGGVRMAGNYTQEVRDAGKSVAGLEDYVNQYKKVAERLKLDRWMSPSYPDYKNGPDSYYSRPVYTISILVCPGRYGGVRAELGDIISYPEKNPQMYLRNGKYTNFTPENVEEVKRLLSMEKKLLPQLTQIRQSEDIARVAGFKEGVKRGSLLGGALAVGLMLGASVKRKFILR